MQLIPRVGKHSLAHCMAEGCFLLSSGFDLRTSQSLIWQEIEPAFCYGVFQL